MSPVTPALFRQLQDVLKRAFDRNGLLQLATLRLAFESVRFADLVDFGKSDDEIAFQMIQVADQRGYVEHLVRAIEIERPGLPEVVAVVVAFGLAPAAPGAPPPAQAAPARDAVLRDAVLLFNDRFQYRQKHLRYLNAYKQLHDVLHDLQEHRADIQGAVAAARRPAEERPDLTGVTDRLQDWVRTVQESAQRTEFPDRPPRWIGKFAQATADVVGELVRAEPPAIDIAKVDRAAAVLANLPAEEQEELNARLVECARRLETEDLLGLISGILSNPGAGQAADLRAGLETFQVPCRQLTDLIADHDLCQQVDVALHEAAGLQPLDDPRRLSQWAQVKGWLQQLADRHPSQPQATRPAESARLSEAAAEASNRVRARQAFDRLQERFNDLFLHTDKALLEVTRDLVVAARVLDATLRRFL